MRSSFTRRTHSKTVNFGIPQRKSDEKLTFVEHVLGVLIESRFGPDRTYTMLARNESANFKCLSVDELEAHLKYLGHDLIPFYAALGRAGSWANDFLVRVHHRIAGVLGRMLQKPARSKGITPDITITGRNLATSAPATTSQATHSRGSPKLLGRIPYSGSPTATNIKA